MKTLFRESVLEKLKKVPTFLWFLLFAATEFFADAFGILQQSKQMALTYAEVFEQAGALYDATVFEVMFSVLTPIVSAAIAELIFLIAYKAVRRFAGSVTRADFCFRVRLVIMISNVILGLIGITYFFVPQIPEIRDIVLAALQATVPALLLGWFYEDFRSKFIPQRLHAKAFLFVAALYLGIYFTVGVVNLLYTLLFYLSEVTTLELVAIIVNPIAVLAVAGVAAIDYFRLKKLSSVPVEPEEGESIDKSEEKPKDDTIFKDFGF